MTENNKPYLKFFDRSNGNGPAETEASRLVRGWHKNLLENKKAAQRLRRATSVEEALQEVEAVRLLGSLKSFTVYQDSIARTAMALAWVKENDDRTFGLCLAEPGGKGKKVSETRVRLMVSSPDPDTFLKLVRSNLSIIGYKAPILHIASAIVGWGHTNSRAWLRRSIMLEYLESVVSQDARR